MDPDATLPALYIVGRDMSPASPALPVRRPRSGRSKRQPG
jgi:hypothetical protein